MLTKKNIFRIFLAFLIAQAILLFIKIDVDLTIVISDDISWWLVFTPSIVIVGLSIFIIALLGTMKM